MSVVNYISIELSLWLYSFFFYTFVITFCLPPVLVVNFVSFGYSLFPMHNEMFICGYHLSFVHPLQLLVVHYRILEVNLFIVANPLFLAHI